MNGFNQIKTRALRFVSAALRSTPNALIETSVFYRSWALYLESGQSSLAALASLRLTVPSSLKIKIQEILSALRKGKTLHDAMRTAGFPVLDVGLIEVAEVTGSLPEVLTILAARYEERASLLRALRKSMTKPGLVFFVSAVTRSLPDLVGGKISATHYELQIASTVIALWLFTRILYSLMGFNPSPGSELLYRLNSTFLRFGPIGRFIRNADEERLFMALSLGFRSGASLQMILRHIEALTLSPKLRRGLAFARARMQAKGISEAFRLSGAFRPEQVQALAVGEEAGHLEEATLSLAQEAKGEVARQMAQFEIWAPKFIYFFSVLFSVAGMLGLF